jgi:hypothetical protein
MKVITAIVAILGRATPMIIVLPSKTLETSSLSPNIFLHLFPLFPLCLHNTGLLSVVSSQEIEGPACIPAGRTFLDACEAERATIEETYSLGSTDPITLEQQDQALAAVTASPECCEAAAPFASSGCQCEDVVAAVLPNFGVEQQGLISAVNLLKVACAEDANLIFDVPPC